MFERIGTATLHNKTVSDFQKSQAELGKLQRQISSGIKADTFNEVGQDLSRLINIDTIFKSNSNYIRQNELVLNRLRSYGVSIKQLQDIATEMRSNLVQERSSSGPSLPLTNIAKNLLAQVEDSLNAQTEGRYIFSGSKTNVKPVAGLKTLTNIINQAPSDNYYSGDNVVLTTKSGDDLDISYGVRANESAFKNLIASLNRAVEGDNGNDDKLVESLDLLNAAIDQLSDLSSTIGNSMKTVENANKQHNLYNSYLGEVKSEIISTDIAEATIQVTLHQTTLQASFQIFARISSLKLTDFLR